MALLEVNHLNISFGGLHAVDDFHVSIEKGQLYGLIGPNGAGKTTIFNLLTGVYKPDEGIINLDGQDITGKSTIDINKAGIARTFQNIRLFKDLSVLDNVKAGLHNHYKYSTAAGIFRLPRYYKTEKQMDEKALELLLMLVRQGEAARRMLPTAPIVSSRSFAERSWPYMLAWSDLGLNGKERMTVDSLARAEVRRFADEDTSERMRGEMMGILGELLGISPEQMEELRSEDGQRRLHEGMKKFEGEVQDAIDKMMGGQGGSQGGPQGGPMPHPPVDPRRFPFFSQN